MLRDLMAFLKKNRAVVWAIESIRQAPVNRVAKDYHGFNRSQGCCERPAACLQSPG
jgi:hypothetical protein